MSFTRLLVHDPARRRVRAGLENAVSVAGVLLLAAATLTAIADEPKQPELAGFEG